MDDVFWKLIKVYMQVVLNYSKCYKWLNTFFELPPNFDICSTFNIKDLVIFKRQQLTLVILLKPIPYFSYHWHKRNITMLFWKNKLFLLMNVRCNESQFMGKTTKVELYILLERHHNNLIMIFINIIGVVLNYT